MTAQSAETGRARIALVTGALGLIAGLVIGFFAGGGGSTPPIRRARSQDEPRIDPHAEQAAPDGTVRETVVVDSVGDSAPNAEVSATTETAELRPGTYPVPVHKPSDQPYGRFAESIFPTPDQLGVIVGRGRDEYVRLQIEARLAALSELLGDDFDAARQADLRRFYEEWAVRKFVSHDEYLRKRARAGASIHDPGQLSAELSQLARGWALESANLKIEHKRRLGDTFAGELFQKHEAALWRLGKYSEVASTLRDERVSEKKEERK